MGCGFEHGQLDGEPGEGSPDAAVGTGTGSGSETPPAPTATRTCAFPGADLKLCFEFNDALVVLDGSDGHLDPSTSGLEATMRPATPPDPAVRIGAGDTLSVKESMELDITSAITLEAWIRPAQFRSANLIRNDGQYRMTINDAGYIGCEMAGKEVHSYSRGMVKANEWHHVACTFDGTQIRAYIDGSSSDCENDTNSTIAPNGTTGTQIAPDFAGDVDGVRIYARDLGANDELCHHAGQTSCQRQCNSYPYGGGGFGDD
jgi:hypothetical protein